MPHCSSMNAETTMCTPLPWHAPCQKRRPEKIESHGAACRKLRHGSDLLVSGERQCVGVMRWRLL